MTSVVGTRPSPGGVGSTDHKGTDFGVPSGTPVYSAADGTVSYVGNNPGGYGNYIVVDHADGTSTLYAHLSSTGDSYVGQTVGTDSPIGLSGQTGAATGPHLHYEHYNTDDEELQKPFGDNQALNDAAGTKGSKVTKDGSSQDNSDKDSDSTKGKNGNQDGTDENDKKNGEVAKKTKPLDKNSHKDITGTPSNYQQTTTKSAVTVLPTHEPWSGHPVSCKGPRGGDPDSVGTGSGGGSQGGGKGGGGGGKGGGSGSGSGSGSGGGGGSGVDSPTNGKKIRGLTDEQTQDYLDRLGYRESGNRYGIRNGYGYSGRFQFGTSALVSTGYMTRGGNSNSRMNDPSNWTGKNGINSLQDYLNSPTAQTDSAIALANQNIAHGFKTGALDSSSSADDIAGYAAASHLKGAGAADNLFKNGTSANDANGTSNSSYRRMMQGIGTRKKKKKPERGDPRKEGEGKEDPKAANNKNGKPGDKAADANAKATNSSGSGSGTSNTPAAYSPPPPSVGSGTATTPDGTVYTMPGISKGP